MSPRDCGAYDIVDGQYEGVTLEAPAGFWQFFDEKAYRQAGYG